MFTLRLILIAAVTAAPVAAYADCANPIYKKNHPYECLMTSKGTIGAGLALAGAAAIGGAAMALGGGGGGGSSATPMPTMNTYDYVGGDVSASHIAAVTSDDKYSRNQAQYDSIRLAYSLARGITGKNSTIAVLDANSWHGAAVTAVAAGPIAPDAVVEKYSIAGANNKFISYGEIGDVVVAAAHADIINASWNTEMRANAVRTRAQMAGLTDQNFIDSLSNAARGGTIFVWAAGNEGAAESGALSALPRVVPEMQGHFINVVAWDDNTGALADYSNACGITKEYCIRHARGVGHLVRRTGRVGRRRGTARGVPIHDRAPDNPPAVHNRARFGRTGRRYGVRPRNAGSGTRNAPGRGRTGPAGKRRRSPA